ncbi:MAG: hypothetical protein ACI9YB_002384 [Halioglobus sp.]|jgi:hypothetical protein
MRLSFSGIANSIKSVFTLSRPEHNTFSRRVEELKNQRADIQAVWDNSYFTARESEELGKNVNTLQLEAKSLNDDLSNRDSTLAKVGRVFLKTFFGKTTEYGRLLAESRQLNLEAANYARDLSSELPSQSAAGSLGRAAPPRPRPLAPRSGSRVARLPFGLDCSKEGIKNLRESSPIIPGIVTELANLKAGSDLYRSFDFAQNERSMKNNIQRAASSGEVTRIPQKITLQNSFGSPSPQLARLQESIAAANVNLTHDINPRGDGNCMLSATGCILAEGLQQRKIQDADLTNLLRKTTQLLAHNNMDANAYCTQKFSQGVGILHQLMRNPSTLTLSALVDRHDDHQAFLYVMRMMSATAVIDNSYLNSIRQIHSTNYGILPDEVDNYYDLERAHKDHFSTLIRYSDNADWETSVAFFDQLNVGFDLFILGGRIGEPHNFQHNVTQNASENKVDGIALMRTGGHYHALSA